MSIIQLRERHEIKKQKISSSCWSTNFGAEFVDIHQLGGGRTLASLFAYFTMYILLEYFWAQTY